MTTEVVLALKLGTVAACIHQQHQSGHRAMAILNYYMYVMHVRGRVIRYKILCFLLKLAVLKGKSVN